MRWQGPARLAMAAIGLGCAGALVAYSHKRPPQTAPPPTMTDPTATSQQNGVSATRLNLNTGKGQLKIEAERQIEYSDGRIRMERPHYTTTRPNGTTFEIWAEIGESQGKAVTGDAPGQIALKGHVRVKASDGLELLTDSATYDNVQGLATIPGKVTFVGEGLKGEGVGATYDHQREVIWLLDQAHVTRPPDKKGEGGIDARAKGIGLARNEKYMNLTEHATIVQAGQTLAADNAIVHFTDDEHGAKLIEMTGNARVTPSASAKKDAPDMQAENINLEFQADGQTLRHAMLMGKARLVQATDQGKQTITAGNIDVITGADGRTLTNLDAKPGVEVQLPPSGDTPGRTITGASLVASGDDKGLKVAIFDGGVGFREQMPAAPASRSGGAAKPGFLRTATSNQLTLDLKGQLGAIDKAGFRGNVLFKDGEMTAAADICDYDEAKGILLLKPANPAPGKPADPVAADDGTVHVVALSIQIDIASHNIDAADNVVLTMNTPKAGSNTRTPSLFDGTQVVSGKAATLKYLSATRVSTLTGTAAVSARVYQGTESQISATDRIEIEQETGNLRAVGDVLSRFQLENTSSTSGRGKPAPAPPAPAKAGATATATSAATPARPTATTVTAREMSYIDADRKATYLGDAAKLVKLTGPDGVVDARQVILLLAKDQRALRTLEATGQGDVFATFQGGREAIGDRLTYDTVTETHVITGAPMYFKNVDTKEQKCTFETSSTLIYEGKTQSMTEPGNTGAFKPSAPMLCTQTLKAAAAAAKVVK